MEVRETKEQKTICIHETTNVRDLPAALGKGYGEIMEAAGKKGISPSGAPYALYLNDDMENLEIEYGFPVLKDFEAEGRVRQGSLSGGRIAAKLYTGPYSGIGQAYETLTEEIKKEGLSPNGVCYEVYIDDPNETAPENLRTEICFFLDH